MQETNIITPFLYCAAIIVAGIWFFFAARYAIFCYKHDSYIKKHFPNLARQESVSIFGGNWNGIRVFEKIFSTTAPDENVSLMRRKIRRSWFGVLLSLSVMPGGFFVLLLLTLILKSEL
jgi:hypothetical protein